MCVVCVTLRLCVCLAKESWVTESNYGSTREQNAGSEARESDVICYVLALILLQGYKRFVKVCTSRDNASLLLVHVLNVSRLIALLLFSTSLFSSFLLLLPTHLFLDHFWVCLQPPIPEPSATARRRRCRRAVTIGLELHFLQLIARNRHEGVHVHLLSTSQHPSVTHTLVRMWMHAVVMYAQAAHVHDTRTLYVHSIRALYTCIYVYMCSSDIGACARSRICVLVRTLSPLSCATHRCHVLPLQLQRRVLG